MARAILKRSKVLVMDEVRFLVLARVFYSSRIYRRQQQGNVDFVMEVRILKKDDISVDYATDELIGKTIRQFVFQLSTSIAFRKIDHIPNREFANSTILTIAHRLRTVIDYDRVNVFHIHCVCITHVLAGNAPRSGQNCGV